MPDATLDTTIVVLSDWRGHCQWSSATNLPLQPGDFVWKNLVVESQREAKERFSRVVTLRETQFLEANNQRGERYRVWMWPLNSPDMAVCLLGFRVPAELALLTDRERECLELLAQGIETREIAKQLGVSLSTIHTHLKRTREKLHLPTVESLISFAARFCYPASQPLHKPHAWVPIEHTQ